MSRKNKEILITALSVTAVVLLLVGGIFLLEYKKINYDDASEKQSQSSQASKNSSVAGSKQASVIDVEGDNAGGSLNIELFAKLGYELRFLFTQESFSSPSEISVNKLVQYAFCHIFNESLTDMPEASGMTYREAAADQINAVLLKHFNLSGVNIQSSDLYNKGSGKFEMWEPKYSQSVFAHASSVKVTDEEYEITVTFYKSKSKGGVLGKSVLGIKKSGDNFYIFSMK